MCRLNDDRLAGMQEFMEVTNKIFQQFIGNAQYRVWAVWCGCCSRRFETATRVASDAAKLFWNPA